MQEQGLNALKFDISMTLFENFTGQGWAGFCRVQETVKFRQFKVHLKI